MKWKRASRLLWVGLILTAWGAQGSSQEAIEEKVPTPRWLMTEKERRAEEEPQEVISERPVEEIESLIARTLRRIKGSVETADFPSLEIERRRRLVVSLAAEPHPKTLAALKKILTGRYEPKVCGAAAWSMGHMKFERDKTAKYLCSRIKREWAEEDILVGIAQGLGELRRLPDRKAAYSFFNHPSDAVYVSMIECLGVLGEREHLAKLHNIFSQYAKKSTAGVNVRVDTGTAGGGDQAAATARGQSAMKKARVVRREGALLATQMAVKYITGEKFEFANEMFDWMKAKEDELKIKLR